MDRKVAADAMAGAVPVIHARLPQVHARQHIQRTARRSVGKAGEIKFDMALQHAGVAVDHFRSRLARTDPHGAGDVGRAVGILAARIAQVDAGGRDRDIAVLVHLVMRQGGVAGCGTDGVEAGILHVGAEAAQFAQLGRRAQFIDFARGRVLFDPAQVFDHGRAVARLRIAVALAFGLVLDRLGQDCRIIVAHDFRPARLERVEDTGNGMLGIDRDGLAREFCQRRLELVTVANAHGIAEVLREFRRDLVRCDEQFGRAVGMGQDIGQRDRRVVDVGAAHVEQPCHRIERADHGRVVSFALQPVGDLGALVGAGAAGETVIMRDGSRLARLGPVAPDRVDRIAVDRDQFDALLGEQLLSLFRPADAVQPCVVADLRALRRIGGDPFGRASRGHVLVIVELAVDLFAHLYGVAAVGEHGGPVLQHHRAACAAAEAGQPVQALGIGADIFAHVLVGNRHDETVEAPLFEFGPERIETRFVGLHKHACGEASRRIVTLPT